MATDARKHTAPAPLETPRREAINKLSESINDFVPVANTTERAQLLVDLAALTPPYVPSAARPLVISRADAPAGAEFEYTVDGSNWRTLAGTSAAAACTLSTGWTQTSGSGNTVRVRRLGDVVYLKGSVTRGGAGVITDILTVPAAFQPPTADTRPVGLTVTSVATFGMLFLASGRLTGAPGYGTIASSGIYSLPFAVSWVMD